LRVGLRPCLVGTSLAAVLAAAAGTWSGCASHHRGAPAQGFNLLLVTVDTVRADHLGAYGDAAAQTPNLDSLARGGARFEHAESPVPLTLPAHASILSGLLPPRHRLRQNGFGRFPETVPTLATRLSAAGYRTGAFVGAFVLDRRFGLARGFDVYDDDIHRDPNGPPALEAERRGREVVDRALAWLEGADNRPFFAWVHLYDAHAPYDPPEPYRQRFADRPYDGEIAEVDAQVGRLLEALERRGWSRRTVVAVAGDHGEALGEHGELTHGLLIYEASLHVPLLVRAPDVLPRGLIAQAPVSLVDLAPTLAALLGHPLDGAGEPALDGRDLSPFLCAGREPPASDVYSESYYATMFGWSALSALRRGDLKYIAAPRPELYDLHRDPGELHNLLPPEEATSRPLAAALTAVAGARPSPSAGPTPDAETRARLASLGYLAGVQLGGSRAAAGKDPKDMVGLFRGFEEAHRATAEGRLEDAKRELERMVAADPDNPVFVGQLAEAYRRTDQPQRAVELYRRAVALAPSDRDARYNLAITLREAGRPEEALAALTAAITLDPANPEAHNALGITLSARGDLEAARAQFAEAIRLDPHGAAARNNLGNALRDLKRADEAEAAYRAAIDLAPRYADPWNGLGTLEIQRDHYAAAIADLDRALALAPALREAELNRAIALQLSGQREAAAKAYRDLVAATAAEPQSNVQRQAAMQLLARLEQAGPSS